MMGKHDFVTELGCSKATRDMPLIVSVLRCVPTAKVRNEKG